MSVSGPRPTGADLTPLGAPEPGDDARAVADRLEEVEGAGPSWLSFLDQASNVEQKIAAVREDGRIDVGDVVALVQEAKDLGGIQAEERAVLVALLEDAPELFTREAYEGLALYLDVPVTPFHRPQPEEPHEQPHPVEEHPSTPAFDPAKQPVVRLGASGPEVIRLQRALNDWRAEQGLPALSIDGGFGGGTKRAVMAFQRAMGLEADGVVGRSTWEALARFAKPVVIGGTRSERFAATPLGPRTRWTRSLEAAWRDVPGETAVFTSRGNGGRPLAVHVPPGFDPGKPAKVVTFFHGHGWNVGIRFAREKVLDRVRALQQADPQTIFVFPQAGRPPFSGWMRKPRESFARMMDEAVGAAATLAGARELEVERRVVGAHSGGGLALANAVRSGEFAADKINLLDSSYGSWSQTVTRWARRQPRPPRIESWYTTHASQPRNNAAIARLAPELVTTHLVGRVALHNTIPGKYFGTP